MEIGTLNVGPGEPCALVAELSNNHNGSLDRAVRLLNAAKAAGASAAKLQCYTSDELVALRGDGPAPEPWGTRGYTMRTLYERAQTPLAWFPTLYAHAGCIGLPLFSSVFGPASFALLESVGNPVYKISHFEATNRTLLELVASAGKPMIVSLTEPVGWIQDTVDATLFCTPNYPTDVADVHLPRFGEIADGDYAFTGVSTHCLAPELPIAAVARGAQMIEYHFQLDSEPSDLEREVSLPASRFAAMVESVRRTEALLR